MFNVTVIFQVEIATQHAQRTCTGSVSPSFGLCERPNHWHEEHGSIILTDRAVNWLYCNVCKMSDSEMGSGQQRGKMNMHEFFQKDYTTRRLALTNERMTTAEIRAEFTGSVLPRTVGIRLLEAMCCLPLTL